jgi:hypothetical protein
VQNQRLLRRMASQSHGQAGDSRHRQQQDRQEPLGDDGYDGADNDLNRPQTVISTFDGARRLVQPARGASPDAGHGYPRSNLDAIAHAVRTVRMKLLTAILATFK